MECPVCSREGKLVRVEDLEICVCENCASYYQVAWKHKETVNFTASMVKKCWMGWLLDYEVLRKIISKLLGNNLI